MKKHFCTLLFALLPLLAQAQVTVSVETEQAGYLSELFQEQYDALSLSEENQLTTLVISGPMNGTDFKFLKALLDKKPTHDYTEISVLDMSDVRVVAGGEPYSYDGNRGDGIAPPYDESRALYTKDDEFGECILWNCTSLTQFILPKTLKYIGELAIAGLRNVKEIEIPEGVTRLGASVFCYDTGLERIRLPKGLLSVDRIAFRGCYALKQLICRCTPPAYGFDAFREVDMSQVEIVLPWVSDFWNREVEKDYQKADGWRNVGKVYSLTPEQTLGIAEPTAAQGERSTPADNRYYRLDGTQADPPQRGLYIRNGQKVVVK